MTGRGKQEIAPYEGQFAVLESDEELAALVQENIIGDGLRPSDIPIVRWPAVGSHEWTLDGVGGEERLTQIVGVPLTHRVTRAFYEVGYVQGSKESPDCSSPDGIEGFTKPLADDDPPDTTRGEFVSLVTGEIVEFGDRVCDGCPLNEWESYGMIDKRAGRGKACREYRNIVILEPQALMPLIVRVPAGQLRRWDDWCKNMTYLQRLPMSQALVKLSLVRENDDIDLHVETIGTLTTEQQVALKGHPLLAPVIELKLLEAPVDVTDEVIQADADAEADAAATDDSSAKSADLPF